MTQRIVEGVAAESSSAHVEQFERREALKMRQYIVVVCGNRKLSEVPAHARGRAQQDVRWNSNEVVRGIASRFELNESDKAAPKMVLEEVEHLVKG